MTKLTKPLETCKLLSLDSLSKTEIRAIIETIQVYHNNRPNDEPLELSLEGNEIVCLDQTKPYDLKPIHVMKHSTPKHNQQINFFTDVWDYGIYDGFNHTIENAYGDVLDRDNCSHWMSL